MCFAIRARHLWCRGSQPKRVSNPACRRPTCNLCVGFQALACDAPTYCVDGGFDLWVATNASVPPPAVPCPAPTPAPTPTPPPFVKPTWHLPARCEEGDVNALFQFEGNWHLMQQWHARPLTSVGALA